MALKKNKKIKITIIGSGNIAWHIVSHLSFFKRFDITVYNRSVTPRLKQLHKEFKVNITAEWKKVKEDSDIFFICSGDNSIKQVATKIKKLKTKALV
ncbi:MAG TPA: NAD(P)-binding domain-containing protein, partial [Bacteroidia bacterium]|nr:NAD(P)-binding domain-containing protein [Bacteroidia bacterium]